MVNQCHSEVNAHLANVPSCYSQLDLDRLEIRLCRLDVTSRGGSIRCTLEHAYLQDSPVYFALSYVWGDPGGCSTIALDGAPKGVTSNLHAALEKLRDHSATELVWVDALCINQDDVKEKSQQVALMRRIFTSATRVLVFLGQEQPDGVEESDTQAGAEEFAMPALKPVDFLNLLASDQHFHDLPCFEKCDSGNCQSPRQKSQADASATLKALAALMRSAWFERTWTIQEIVLSRQASVLFGDEVFDWELLTNAWMRWGAHLNSCCGGCILGHDHAELTLLYEHAARVLDLVHTREALTHPDSLLYALFRFRWRKSTDPRDSIYGLFGLHAEAESVTFKPDYSLDLSSVLISFAITLIRTRKWPITLHLNPITSIGGLPSWVPDWTSPSVHPTDFDIMRLQALKMYQAAADLEGEMTITTAGELQVTACKIDTIVKVSSEYVIKRTPAEQMQLIHQWHSFMDFPNSADKPYSATGTLQQAFDSTMFAGVFFQGLECRTLLQADIDPWKQSLRKTVHHLRSDGPDIEATRTMTTGSHTAACLDRRLFVSQTGYIGLCPGAAAVGDSIFVVKGSPAPVFLRHANSDELAYSTLGDGYVPGLMNGEAASLDLPLKLVRIV